MVVGRFVYIAFCTPPILKEYCYHAEILERGKMEEDELKELEKLIAKAWSGGMQAAKEFIDGLSKEDIEKIKKESKKWGIKKP
jgi:hypothetical protein